MFVFCVRARGSDKPCGHRLQRSPVCWLRRCWLAAASKCCWPPRTTSRRASASLTVSPRRSHIMTPVSHLQVPAFSITINGFTCADMLPMRRAVDAPCRNSARFFRSKFHKHHVRSPHRLPLISCPRKVGRDCCCSTRAALHTQTVVF